MRKAGCRAGNAGGWTLIELMLTCGLLAILGFVAVVRFNPGQRTHQDVEMVARQLRHALELTREQALHDRTATRLVVSEDPSPRYWIEQEGDLVWEPFGSVHLLNERVSFGGDLSIAFQPDGTGQAEYHLQIQEGSAQQQIVVQQPTGRIAYETGD